MKHPTLAAVCLGPLLVTAARTAPPDRNLEFRQAAGRGDLATVQALLDAGVPVNTRDKYGRTALHFAANGGQTQVVQWLLDRGANLESRTVSFESPLMYAGLGCRAGTAKLLLDRGADVYVLNRKAWNVQMFAVQFHCAELEALLQHAGAYAPKPDDSHVRTIHATADAPLHVAAQAGDLAIVAALLGAGHDVNAQDSNAVTPLYLAAQNGRAEVARLLIGRGAEVDVRAPYDITPLWIAAQNGHADVVRLLIAQGARVNVRKAYARMLVDSSRRETYRLSDGAGASTLTLEGVTLVERTDWSNASALYIAAASGHTEVVAALLGAGAKPDEVTAFGWTPLRAAQAGGHDAIVQLLEAAGARE